MTDNVIVSLFLGLGIFGTPGFLMVIWLMWRELRDTQELADYYAEQWESLHRQQHAEDHNMDDWLADW